MSQFPSGPSLSFSQPPLSQSDSKVGLRHVSIKQVLNATHVETHFEIDGREVGLVMILANVYDVSNRGAKLDYGLDDGTGRIRAYSWIANDNEVKREVTEYEETPFSYARVIGKISEYRRIYSIELVKISRVVKEPHELIHHYTRTMVESLMITHGPPNRAIVESVSQAAKANFPPPEAVTTKPLRGPAFSPPDIDKTKRLPVSSPSPPPRTPSPKAPQTPRGTPRSEPRFLQSPGSPLDSPQPSTVPRRRNYRIGGYPSSPSLIHGREVPPSLPQAQPRRPSRPPLGPLRFRSPSGPSSATAALIHYQASPEFVSSTSSPPSSPTRNRSIGGAEVSTVSIPPRELITDVTPDMRVARRMVHQQRDPYFHLSTLQRDIILTIQNSLSTSGRTEQGISIRVLVRTIASRRSDISDNQFDEAFAYLLEEGYIYNTIDDIHVACT